MIKEAVTKSSPAAARKKAQAPPIKPSYQVPSMESHVFATHLYPVNPPLTHVRISLLCKIRGEAKDKTFHCTPACEAGGGNVPNLQCVKCVCLFHSECCQMPPQTVSLIHSAIARFLCPNCYREESTTKTYLEPFKPSIAFEPLAFDPSSDSEDEGLVSDFEHPSYIRVNMRPRTPPLPPLPPLVENSRQIGNLKSPSL
ncbi:hypothetical protein Avbf_07498 [Armadillidium vulgare]|nr:hypothetical protein Avbf_07498 [Armadillidium vulgare]